MLRGVAGTCFRPSQLALLRSNVVQSCGQVKVTTWLAVFKIPQKQEADHISTSKLMFILQMQKTHCTGWSRKFWTHQSAEMVNTFPSKGNPFAMRQKGRLSLGSFFLASWASWAFVRHGITLGHLRSWRVPKMWGLSIFKLALKKYENKYHQKMLEQKSSMFMSVLVYLSSELSGLQIFYLFWSCFSWCFYSLYMTMIFQSCGNLHRSSVGASPAHGLKAAVRTMPKLG